MALLTPHSRQILQELAVIKYNIPWSKLTKAKQKLLAILFMKEFYGKKISVIEKKLASMMNTKLKRKR